MFERYRRWDMQDGRMDARRLTATRHSFKFRIAGRGRKGSQRFSWTAANDPKTASTDPHLCRTGFLRRELARSRSGQIKKLRGVLAVFPGATEALNALGAQILTSVCQITCLANSLLKPLACRFARKLKWANIPVN
jgi:hypothetical protein